MANLISQIIGYFKKKKSVNISLRPEDLSENEKLEAAKNEATFYKARLLKLETKISQLEGSRSNKDKEEEKVRELNEQEKEINKKRYVSVDLSKLFKLIDRQKKIKDKSKRMQFTTFDGKVLLGPVDSLNFGPDGSIECVSRGKIIWAGKTLKQIFYWPSGLNNYIKRGIIPLCVDDKGRYVPNLMHEELPQYVRLKNGKYKINRVNTVELEKLVAESQEEMSDLYKELESTEELVSELQKEVNDKTRETNVHKNRADKIETELSLALEKVAQLDKAVGIITRQNSDLTQVKEINEKTISAYEESFETLLEKIEDEAGKTVRDKVQEEFQNLILFARENMGNVTQVIQPEKEEQSITDNIRPRQA